MRNMIDKLRDIVDRFRKYSINRNSVRKEQTSGKEKNNNKDNFLELKSLQIERIL